MGYKNEATHHYLRGWLLRLITLWEIKEVKINIYKISQTENNDYETFDSMVVVAANEEEARLILPSEYDTWEDMSERGSNWCSSPDKVTVKYLGEYLGEDMYVRGIILTSYNAG